MFGISSFEFLIILLIGVVVLGPEKLPKVMRTFNKAMSEFRRIRTDLHRAVNLEIANQEHEERKREAEAELLRDPGAANETRPAAETAPEADTPLDRPKTDSLHVSQDELQAGPQPAHTEISAAETESPDHWRTSETVYSEPVESAGAIAPDAPASVTEITSQPAEEKARA